MQGKLNYPICNVMMDTYHEPHGASSGFESEAGLSFFLVRLSSLVEFLMTTLSSTTPSWVWVLIRPLSFSIPEISYVGSFVSHFCSCEA